MFSLKIVTPEKIVFDGEAQSVIVPGSRSQFEILTGHAPIISSLLIGKVVYKTKDATFELYITGGFVEVTKGKVYLCVEC